MNELCDIWEKEKEKGREIDSVMQGREVCDTMVCVCVCVGRCV